MPYKATTVSTDKSKDAISKLLHRSGVKGIQWAENWESHEVNVRFVKDVGGNMRTVSVTLSVPEPGGADEIRWSNQSGKSGRVTKADRWERSEKATYRMLLWWLKAQFEAVEFGLLSFEDVFLSHFEWIVDGQRTTVGALVKPRLSGGSNLLMPPSSDVTEGEYA